MKRIHAECDIFNNDVCELQALLYASRSNLRRVRQLCKGNDHVIFKFSEEIEGMESDVVGLQKSGGEVEGQSVVRNNVGK